jgi:hypothetical protein
MTGPPAVVVALEEIRFVMVDGIAHVPADAIDEYLSRVTS